MKAQIESIWFQINTYSQMLARELMELVHTLWQKIPHISLWQKPIRTYQTYNLTSSRIDGSSSWSQISQEPERHKERKINNIMVWQLNCPSLASFENVHESIHYQ